MWNLKVSFLKVSLTHWHVDWIGMLNFDGIFYEGIFVDWHVEMIHKTLAIFLANIGWLLFSVLIIGGIFL